ncbi:hypothetical protein G3I13_02070 [Streptomyces sp. SID6673]|nr:hypothetical protein [Streptomyces sp. SID11726]NDZ94950.1 hypothetical protein [Streptomyces sp. SID11726]NEB23108.1 hypothetical protein [Streptomyces sp. SID6673]
MAKKITDLPALTVADDTDLFPIVDVSGNVTKKVVRTGLVPDGSVSTAKLANSSVTVAKMATSIEFGGTSLSTGNTPVTFTPTYSGLLRVEARGRRNSGSVADCQISIAATTAIGDNLTNPGIGRGDTDGFVIASLMGSVTAGVAATFTISTSGVTSNMSYNYYVIPSPTTKI